MCESNKFSKFPAGEFGDTFVMSPNADEAAAPATGVWSSSDVRLLIGGEGAGAPIGYASPNPDFEQRDIEQVAAQPDAVQPEK